MKFSILLSVIVSFSSYGEGGSEVGNGGDTIYCKQTDENSFYGYYTLDYLLEFRGNNVQLIKANSFQEYNLKIFNRLKLIYPELIPSFNDFFSALKWGESFNRIWNEANNGLTDIKDENILKLIPKNCLADGRPRLIQTVIRKFEQEKIQYYFEKNILDYQKKMNPLQYSFFMTHEWMWDFTRDVRILRKLNWLFHSQQFQSMTREELIKKFNQWRIFTPKVSYCSRSIYTRSYYPFRDCSLITARSLNKVKELNFSNLVKEFRFNFGELQGFGKVESIRLDNNNLQELLLPRFFSTNYSLKYLSLRNGQLKNLSSEITKDLSGLKELDLRGNPDFIFSTKNCKDLKKVKLIKVEPSVNLDCFNDL